MEINEYIKKLKNLNVIEEAIRDALEYSTSQESWDDCKRGDWMLWLIGKLSGEPESEKRKKLVLTACKCARLSLKYIAKGETRPLKAIETAEAWARGKGVNIQDVHTVADAAWVAAGDDSASAALWAAKSASVAALVAYVVTENDMSAHWASDAAWFAAEAVWIATKERILAKCAGIVRKDYPSVDDLFI